MEAGKSEDQIQFMLSPSKYETPAKSASGVSKYVIYFHPLDLKKNWKKGWFYAANRASKDLAFLTLRRKHTTKPIQTRQELQAERLFLHNARSCVKGSQE